MMDWCSCGHGCDEASCDDACDAAMIDELMMPHSMLHSHDHVAPMYPHGAPMPTPLPYDMNDLPPEPAPPMRMDKAPATGPSERLPKPIDRVPPPVRKPVPKTKSDTDGGSLFDTLSDPFKDDDDASVKPLRSVRPSNYYSNSSQSEAVGSSLSRGYQTSSRRVSRSRR